MSPSVFEEAIKKLIYNPVDVCYTDILVPGFHTFPWNTPMASRKWSRLIRAKRFKAIAADADRVFRLMEEHRVYCPTVTAYNPDGASVGLQLEWRDDDRVLRVYIAAGHPLHYARGRSPADDPLLVQFPPGDLFEVLPVFAKFVTPPKEVQPYDGKRDCA